MAGDEDDALGDEDVGDGDRLLGIALVVADAEGEVLARDAALGVDVLDRLLGAALHLLAEGRIFARHRAGRGDVDVGGLGGRNAERGGECRGSDDW